MMTLLFIIYPAPGTTEGICPQEVLGASQPEGPILSNPFEGSHRLGVHDSRALLYRPGLSTPKGHMVRSLFWILCIAWVRLQTWVFFIFSFS